MIYPMQGLDRVAGWPRLLNEHLIKSQAIYAERGLDWGAFDCCTFAFDWVRDATGFDPMAEYRGRYASKIEAMRALRETGDGTLEGALMEKFGEPVAPALARRGDIAFRRLERAVGVVVTRGPRQVALFLGDQGFSMLAMGDIDHAFRV